MNREPIVAKEQFIGTWVSSLPFDSDDYLIEYSISLRGERFVIKAKDLRDGERLKISDIAFNGKCLEFVSYVRSTKRKGINRFRLKGKNSLESQFTFTVVEELKRVDSLKA
jgi:hypothetical protein